MVERVTLDHQVARDLLRHVDPSSDHHRVLREVTELVGEHGLELAERQHVDHAESDLEILARRDDQVDQREVVVHAGVDPGRREHPVRPGRVGLVGEPVQEREQPRVVGRGQLEVVVGLAAPDEDQRLGHEHGEECGRRRDERERPVVRWANHCGDQSVRCPREPAGECEVQRDE
ncbi:MAG TPA: hypothetical protein VHN14_09420 [Kofleriaceae bacterium]|nr:hypothetical protein [Kofleriaceae bacterium]